MAKKKQIEHQETSFDKIDLRELTKNLNFSESPWERDWWKPKMIDEINEIRSWYPKDIFPDARPGSSTDSVAATMARHILNIIEERVKEL